MHAPSSINLKLLHEYHLFFLTRQPHKKERRERWMGQKNIGFKVGFFAILGVVYLLYWIIKVGRDPGREFDHYCTDSEEGNFNV